MTQQPQKEKNNARSECKTNAAPSSGFNPTKKGRFHLSPFTLLILLIFAACPREWDNPRDPNSPNYQGYKTVNDPNDMTAETPDNTSLDYQNFTVDEVSGAQSYRLEVSSSPDFTEGNILFQKDNFLTRYLGADADLSEGEYGYWRAAAQKNGVWGNWTAVQNFRLWNPYFRLWNPYETLAPADGTVTFRYHAGFFLDLCQWCGSI